VSYPDAPIARAVASDEGAGGDGARPA
jgi:hypothetical protein